MAVTLQDLFGDPALFLHQLDGNTAIFQAMTREDLARSIFLDGRIRHGGRTNFRVPLDRLLAEATPDALPLRRIGWIFHVAQCGSTLLARALDLPGRSLVLREPLALRQLGVAAGAATSAPVNPAPHLLRLVAATLGKRWQADRPVVIKANVPVNFIAGQLLTLDPEAPAIALHFPLAQYVAAILRTEGHVRWTEGVFAELRLDQSPYVAGASADSPVEKAAALWFAQMKAFETLMVSHPGVHSLEASLLFDRPAETVLAAARLLEVDMSEEEARDIVGGELFRSYSKNPALDYDPEVRLAREAEAMRRLELEIGSARAWAEAAQARHGLVDALDRPLIGDPVPLLP
jgi:hypothetical protein